jgi:signal transduction histidine kinase
VTLRAEGGRAVLEITDDGSGFDVERPAHRGHGLENFRWRAERLAGEVAVTSTPGRGTTVRLSVPL